jgi:hypothetical protein
MATTGRSRDGVEQLLRTAVVLLTFATAAIHWKLGGPLFTLNAIGYACLAVALVAPLPIAGRFRLVIRLALLGMTLATIGGWVAFGARLWLAYADKAIELVLVAILAADVVRAHGAPRAVLGELRELALEVLQPGRRTVPVTK